MLHRVVSTETESYGAVRFFQFRSRSQNDVRRLQTSRTARRTAAYRYTFNVESHKNGLPFDIFKTEIRIVDSSKVEIRGDKKFVITKKSSEINEIEAKAIIVATGAHFKKLGCEGEAEHIGQGVSFCAVCDGAFFEDLEIAVVGGGNTAVEESIYLTKFASKVYIIHRRDEFRADKAAVQKALANPKITPIYNTVLKKIEGNGMVENIVLENVKTGEISNLPVAGVFMFVGQEPNDECVRGLVKSEKGGWIITDEKMETSVPGIFAAGDVRSKFLRQVITAASDGAIAAMAASKI